MARLPPAEHRGRGRVADHEDAGLEGIELLSGLDSEHLRELAKRCRWYSYRANETVLDRSSDRRDVFFVISGAVRIVNYSSSGREIAFANVRAGGFFGELSAIDGGERSASVVAREASRLASLSPDIFARILREKSDVATRVMMRLAAIIRSCDDRIMDLSTLRAVHRVYSEVLRLAEPDVVAPKNWVVRPMRTHSEIASRISTTRETVARVLSQLAADGIVERKSRTLYIRDHQRLAKLAQSGADLEDGIAR